MKRVVLFFFVIMSSLSLLAQDADQYIGPQQKELSTPLDKDALCNPNPWISSGYPLWSNWWGGFQFNIINTSGAPLEILNFEARFQGTSGYSIYTKTGTFVGFETNAAAWTLVGSVASLTGTAPWPEWIPINVNVCIPIGGTQAFYLTRTDNLTANRHMYVPGTGTPGTTVYTSNADLGITEAHYVTPIFAANYAQARRPSIDLCYTVGNCTVLPVELISFDAKHKYGTNYISWITSSELNNDYFTLERSVDAKDWVLVKEFRGKGNSSVKTTYEYFDEQYELGVNYYRLSQTDYDGQVHHFKTISIENKHLAKDIDKVYDLFYNEIKNPNEYKGLKIVKYKDGSVDKFFN